MNTVIATLVSILILLNILSCVQLADGATATLTCNCLRDGPTNSTYTIYYTYTLPNVSAPAWLGTYDVGNNPTCSQYEDARPVNPTTTTESSSPLSLKGGNTYYCYLYNNAVDDCSSNLVSGYSVTCSDPFIVTPTGPPVDQAVGPITWSPLGLGLGIGALVGMLCICIIVFIVYKKKQQDKKEKEVA